MKREQFLYDFYFCIILLLYFIFVLFYYYFYFSITSPRCPYRRSNKTYRVGAKSSRHRQRRSERDGLRSPNPSVQQWRLFPVCGDFPPSARFPEPDEGTWILKACGERTVFLRFPRWFNKTIWTLTLSWSHKRCHIGDGFLYVFLHGQNELESCRSGCSRLVVPSTCAKGIRLIAALRLLVTVCVNPPLPRIGAFLSCLCSRRSSSPVFSTLWLLF